MAAEKSALLTGSSPKPADGQHAGSKRGCALWLVIIAVVVGVAGWWVIHNQPPLPSAGGGSKRGGGPVPVVALPAQKADVPDWITVLGTVAPLNNVVIRSRVDGQLMTYNFVEGQTVKAGTLLAEIDPRPYEVALTQVKGQMAQAQALLDNARADLVRYELLWKQDSVQKQVLDTQKSLVHQLEASVDANKGNVASAELNLVYTKITAPLTGRLGLRQVDPGNIIHATDANGLVTMAQMEPIAVIFSIPQERVPPVLAHLKKADDVLTEVWDGDQKTRLDAGKLLATDSSIDVTTGTLKLKAVMPNAEGMLFPSQFVTVRLLVDTLHDSVVIPTAAVQRGSQGNYVYVVKEDQSVTLRPLTLSVTDGERTAVSEGISAGEIVVVDGTDKLRESAKVEVITREGGTPHKNPSKGKMSEK